MTAGFGCRYLYICYTSKDMAVKQSHEILSLDDRAVGTRIEDRRVALNQL